MRIPSLVVTMILAGACGGGDDDPAVADAGASADAASQVDAVMAQPVCTPGTIGLVASPVTGRDAAGLTIDQSSNACGLETDLANPNAERVATFVLQDGDLGFASAFGYEVVTTSHGMSQGVYAGPLPNRTSVTVRLREMGDGDEWDVTFQFDRAAGAKGEVTVTGLDAI